jgi:hypothetical protein
MIYSDTERRMINDSEFHAAVMLLAQLAQQHGFTPGELKQIAFAAALFVEERNPICRYTLRDGKVVER